MQHNPKQTIQTPLSTLPEGGVFLSPSVDVHSECIETAKIALTIARGF